MYLTGQASALGQKVVIVLVALLGSAAMRLHLRIDRAVLVLRQRAPALAPGVVFARPLVPARRASAPGTRGVLQLGLLVHVHGALIVGGGGGGGSHRRLPTVACRTLRRHVRRLEQRRPLARRALALVGVQ